MKFYISNVPINSVKPYILLKPDNWDDFCFKTMFKAYFYSSKSIEELGFVKIAYLGDFPDNKYKHTQNYLNKFFEFLDNNFCSLWQSAEEYEKVREIEIKYNCSIFKPLNDLVTKIDKLELYLKYDVVSTSLFRYISPFDVKNQFYRIFQDETPLSDYNYSFVYDDGDENSDKNLLFEVRAQSYPPTNIHALIGSNGCGKTTAIKKIVNKFMNTDTSEQELESIFLISFNPFDDYGIVFENLKSNNFKKGNFKYIGARDLGNLNLNKNVTELTDQFMESYSACCVNQKKRLELLSFLEEMTQTFNDVREISNLYSEVIDKPIIGEKASSNLREKFDLLSAGYKEVVSIITGAIGFMSEKSLVLMDEPENHLHPPLLSMLIRWLSNILIARNAFAIVATHSPIILQEIPTSCVWIIRRIGEIRKIRRPRIETFGSNLSTLTYEVFDYEIENSGFNQLLKKIAQETKNYDEALQKFNGNIGEEAKGRLRLLCFKEGKL